MALYCLMIHRMRQQSYWAVSVYHSSRQGKKNPKHDLEIIKPTSNGFNRLDDLYLKPWGKSHPNRWGLGHQSLVDLTSVQRSYRDKITTPVSPEGKTTIPVDPQGQASSQRE